MLEIGRILIELDFAQLVFFRRLAIEQVSELGNMHGQAERRCFGNCFIFLPLNDDFFIFHIFFHRQMDPPTRPGRIDQLPLVDNEDVQGILLTQVVQSTFI